MKFPGLHTLNNNSKEFGAMPVCELTLNEAKPENLIFSQPFRSCRYGQRQEN